MGIAKGMFSLLCETERDLRLQGKILELGKQQIYVSPTQARAVLAKFGLPPLTESQAEKITDVGLFKALGFQTVESMDANSYEGADHIHDLNTPIPDALKGQYDVIYDGGTLEHIFDFPQCLRNIYDLLKPGGIIIHASPSHNHVDHGFYMFSPTVFYDYYTTNKFKILKSYIFEYEKDHNSKDWLIYEYTPGSIDHMSFGGWGKKLLHIFFVAQKDVLSTNGVTPQQGTYIREWRGESLSQDAAKAASTSSGIRRLVKSLLTLPGFTIFSGIAYRTYIWYRRVTKGKPRIVARY